MRWLPPIVPGECGDPKREMSSTKFNLNSIHVPSREESYLPPFEIMSRISEGKPIPQLPESVSPEMTSFILRSVNSWL